MPGNLGFSRVDTSFDNTIVYARKQDTRLYRVFEAQKRETDGYEQSETDLKIPGPLADNYPGRLLILKKLYSPRYFFRNYFFQN